MSAAVSDPRYPIGKYEPQPYSASLREQWEADIRFLPAALENAILNLDEAQLDTPYRDGGWTIRQLVHHVADSHINAYCRFKLALTEENPTIKPYDEGKWAELIDTKNIPVNVSLTLLHAVHTRWYEIVRNMSEAGYQRTLFHPESKKTFTLWHMLGMYSWHSRHHTAHITVLREKMKW